MGIDRVLVLLGHGSRAPETLEEMRELAAKLQAVSPGPRVVPAFLNLLQPDLPAAIREAVAAGSRQIDVLPLFFFTGKHVQEDVRKLIAEARLQHPDASITLREAAGRNPAFLPFLAGIAGFSSAKP